MRSMFQICVKKIGDGWFGALLGCNGKLFATSFSRELRKNVIVGLVEHLPLGSSFVESQPHETALRVFRSLHLIYEGRPPTHRFELNMGRTSPFVRKVLLLTSAIPYGFVATYGEIAKAIGKRGAARAVGNAEARNPFSLLIPCHRVIRSNLAVGGYGCGSDTKRMLLEREGVVFVNNCVSRENLWVPRSKGSN